MLLHLIPFFIWFIYVLVDPASLNPKIPFGENQEISVNRTIFPNFSFSFLGDLTINLSRLIYCTAILVLLQRNTSKLPDRVSSINSKNTLSWFKNLVVFYTGFYLLTDLIHIFLPNESLLFQTSATIERSLPAVMFVFLFSLYSEDQSSLVWKGEKGKSESSCTPIGVQKYVKSGLTDTESKSLYSRLNKYLKESKSYLDPELTLNEFAEQMGETRHKVSKVINKESGNAFSTL